MRLLLVEDDEDVARFIRKGLIEQAYAVDVVADGEAALLQTSINPYDAVILDLMIPAPDGLEVCRRLRREGSTLPVLILTARDTVEEKIAGLDAGADDYLAKPFQFGELLARLRALLRRGGANRAPILRAASLEIDTRSHRVTLAGAILSLTTKEYSLLEYLALNEGRIIGREEISEHVWNQDFDPFSNLVEVYVNRLRRNIERVSSHKLIHTVRGAGYMLELRDEDATSGD
jgi:two-component system copper resistance phosphate regulon response regulator CusR